MPTDVVIGVCTISSRSGIDERGTYLRVPRVVVASGVHDVPGIDPPEPLNMSVLDAFE